MFETFMNIFKKIKKQEKEQTKSKDTAKERLHLVLMQDRANVSADFLDLMKQEIIEVIKKYIDVDENEIDVRLTNKENGDGTNGAPALYANIPIVSIKEDVKSGMARQEEKGNEQVAKIENESAKKEAYTEEQNKNDIETIEKLNKEVEKRNQEILNEEPIDGNQKSTFENDMVSEEIVNSANKENDSQNIEKETDREVNFQNTENIEIGTNENNNFQNGENVEGIVEEKNNFENNENTKTTGEETGFQNSDMVEVDSINNNSQNEKIEEQQEEASKTFDKEDEELEEMDGQEEEETNLLVGGANATFEEGNSTQTNHENERNFNKKKNKFNKKKRRNRNQRR